MSIPDHLRDAMRSNETPNSIDTTTPSIARAYDAILGGKDNYEIDRSLVEGMLAVFPESPIMAQENRAWLIRVVRWLAQAGIEQFVDIGSGLPTMENTHQAAQRVTPEARVVYVDNDPMVLSHGRAILEDNEHTRFVSADMSDPDRVFAEAAELIDLTRPIGLIHCSTIHHVPDEADPYGLMQRYIGLMPPGSYLALTHFYDPDDGGYYTRKCRDLEKSLERLGSGFWRTRSTVRAYFDGLEVVPSSVGGEQPALTRLCDWWPNGPRVNPANEADELVIGGVARKPSTGAA